MSASWNSAKENFSVFAYKNNFEKKQFIPLFREFHNLSNGGTL
mgnify:CR=1 FL=1